MKITGGSIRTFFYHRAMYMWTLRICTQILLIFTHFRCLYKLTNCIIINATSPFFENEQNFKQGYCPAFYNPTVKALISFLYSCNCWGNLELSPAGDFFFSLSLSSSNIGRKGNMNTVEFH